MDIGTFREELTIQTVTETRGATGSVAETWADTATVWCNVEYLNTGNLEKVMSGKEVAVHRVFFSIHLFDGLNEKNRIKYRNDLYDIIAIQVSHDRFFNKIEAQKRD